MRPTRRILLVDDDPALRLVFSLCLSKHVGFVVTAAESGSEALHAFRKERFDAVMMDINMPGLDGITTLRRMRNEAMWDPMPAIWLMTGLWTPRIDEEGLAAGARAVLAKPFTAAYMVSEFETAWAETPPIPWAVPTDIPAR